MRDSLFQLFKMDETAAEYVRRMILKMTLSEIPELVNAWGALSEGQLQMLNFQKRKESLAKAISDFCVENQINIDCAADLDIIYCHRHQDKRNWSVYQMSRLEDEETDLFDVMEFRRRFKRSLQTSLKNVTIGFKQYEENAIWIRVAWGTHYTKPDQSKPSYVVYYPQTPCVFVSKLPNTRRPLLCQAILGATNYTRIKEMELRGRCLKSLRDIVFKQFNQAFQTHCPRPLQEGKVVEPVLNPRITCENAREKEEIQRTTLEAFGDGPLPKLQFAHYRLETIFKSESGRLADRQEPFRCVATFSSPHLLEAFKSLAPLGIADAPVSQLLSCIPHKARNYFKIANKKEML
uniref:Centromere protein N n=1 Tax=Latimeria chalumnae TaxID=7897 RepID=M3XJW4_LATCH|nr:PREDICTED: centromere protein N isoform X2 [Latimeria chalumnae]|eukprot:XP_006004914.1 PREDICTED: centromere protein N isoform X2 [Latimeria chalumnae]